MPEEKYRTTIDHLSDVIDVYFDEYRQQGIAEGINPPSITVIQNLIVDVLDRYYFRPQGPVRRDGVIIRRSGTSAPTTTPSAWTVYSRRFRTYLGDSARGASNRYGTIAMWRLWAAVM
jgi:hypothetical protein